MEISEIFVGLTELTPTTLSILGALVLFAILFFILGPKAKFTTKAIVYGGLCVAIAFVLSYIRLYRWPQGGSITLVSMLPIFIYAYIFGPAAGVVAGAACGVLQLIQDPYILHPVQVMLDYIIAFAALGLAGFSRKNILWGIAIGGFGRFFSSFLSGVIFFGSYAPEGMNPIVYSILVNGLVLGTDSLICLVVCLIPRVQHMIQSLKNSVVSN
jgi:thiamine transporter